MRFDRANAERPGLIGIEEMPLRENDKEIRMPQYSEAEIQAAITEITKRSRTDAAFRKLALSNPNAAVKEAANIDVPANFKVKFVESNGANLVVTLPDAAGKEGELSDAELEQVAGGGRGASACGVSCAGASCLYSSVL